MQNENKKMKLKNYTSRLIDAPVIQVSVCPLSWSVCKAGEDLVHDTQVGSCYDLCQRWGANSSPS